MAETLDSIKKENKKTKPKEIKKPSFWTKEEDKILMDKAQEFNYKNWNAIADFIPGRTSIQCSARYRRIRPGLIKGAWDKEEDIKLLALYKKYGKNWAAISKEMPQRTGKQIRDRFLNSLDTKFSRGKFTEEEDQAIIKYFKIYGNSWAKIAKKLKTRTGDMVKNRFYSSLKKTILKNKNFLRRKRLSSSPNIIKNKINEDKNVEAKKNKFSSPFRNHQTNIRNKINEEEEIEINSIKEPNFENFEDKIQAKKEINISYNNPNSYQKEPEEKNQNHIIIKNDSSEDSIDYSDKFNKILTDNCENENRLKNNMNNNTYFNFEDNKKNEIINEPEFNDNINYNYNSDLFAAFGNNVNKNNFYTLYYRDEIDERLDKYKNCPKLELDYKQNLREQLGIIFNLENIINQKLFSVQRQLENN
jgi:hypothetical protein